MLTLVIALFRSLTKIHDVAFLKLRALPFLTILVSWQTSIAKLAALALPSWVSSSSFFVSFFVLRQSFSKFIPRNSDLCFFKIDKACKEIFTLLPRFLKDSLLSEVLLRIAATRTKTALTILQFCFHYFSEFPFKAFGI